MSLLLPIRCMALLTGIGLRINRYCSMTDFPFLKMSAVRHLGFLKVKNFKLPLQFGGPLCVIVPNFAKIILEADRISFSAGKMTIFYFSAF